MFWIENLQELWKNSLTPNNYMTIEEKINAVMRFVIVIGIMATLIFNDSTYILFVLIIMMLSIVIFNYHQERVAESEKYLNTKDIDIIDNQKCYKPSIHNPFMNPNITHITENADEIKNCPIDNSDVNNAMKKYFYAHVFRETDDIYDKNLLERQFYTMPSTTIPNEREKLGDWLYNRGASCKENNGVQCYNNMYQEIRYVSH